MRLRPNHPRIATLRDKRRFSRSSINISRPRTLPCLRIGRGIDGVRTSIDRVLGFAEVVVRSQKTRDEGDEGCSLCSVEIRSDGSLSLDRELGKIWKSEETYPG